MRIGTWNLAGRWSTRHRALLEEADCDVWLLTEVPAAFELDGGSLVRSESMKGTRNRAWAAVWSNEPVVTLPPLHPVAAVVQRGDLMICSCVLPWRGSGSTWPGPESNTAGKTIAALDDLRAALTLGERLRVWGGDWNHAMRGREWAGSKEGQIAIRKLAADAGLLVATADEPHRIDGLLSIDHIAVPKAWATTCRRVVAAAGDDRLSDHDAYVVDAVVP